MDDLRYVLWKNFFLMLKLGSACSSNHVDWANSALNFTQKQSKSELSEIH